MTYQQALDIRVENVSHQYRQGIQALKNVSFELGTGLHGLLGENGAGKSTLMRIICSLLSPSAGNVCIAGFDVVKERHQVRQLLGYLPQEFGAWRNHRVSEVLDTLAMLSGMTASRDRHKRIHEVLAMVGLDKVAGRKVGHLSGGMLRRLGVAQALVHNPRILVMDEPTVGLDPEERLRFRQLIGELSRDRVILLSTHIVADLGASCEQLCLMVQGQLKFCGKPQDLVNRAAGKVWQVSLSRADEASVPDSFEVVSRQTRDGQSLVRGVCHDHRIPEGAAAADNITLEEAYLAFTVDTGKHAA
ncbi:ATP-binding cassette domain-containing protein [Microbulbifer sp. TYP-18]|uniref:ATP-binding cassette domain-containing protein n=1 Tax=Microbulbifer sp. TYP-18 TaxID=3230024 RepID=UPI0034C693E1